MKHTRLLTLLVILLATLTIQSQPEKLRHPENTTGTDETKKNEAEIQKWLDRWTKAFRARDVDAIMALYAPGVVAYDLVPPLQYVGKDAYRKNYREFFDQYPGPVDIEVRDLHIVTSETLAYSIGLERVTVMQKSGEKSDIWLRFTSCYQKLNGKWLDTHDHISVPADLETGKAALDLKP